jgi:serine/threonine-protein kinase HipA
MAACLICLEPLGSSAEHHPRCLKGLFGAPRLPQVDVELGKLHTVGLAMVGRTTLSGVQRKVSLNLEGDRKTLQLALGRGRYILKPQASTYPALPENEHVTMRLASLAGIETPPCGLLRLKDGTPAYIVARFDRTPEGRKLPLEDFCQLAEKPAKEKYDGSAELCARLVRRFATEPLVELLKLYRLMVFAWWTGNGDMHLKNFSLLGGEDGIQRLAPAYDQLSTRLVIPEDDLALPVVGRKSRLSRASWLEYAAYCGLPERAAARVLAEVAGALDQASALVASSLLGASMVEAYRELLRDRARLLAAG